MVPVQNFVRYLRANPQLLILLIVCVVLGLGTFLAVIISLASSGNGEVSGEPSDVIFLFHLLPGGG